MEPMPCLTLNLMRGRASSLLTVPLLALPLAVLLGACAPAATKTAAAAPVQASTSVSSVSFYPRETGLGWTYLPEGEPAGGLPYTLRALGPTVFAGQTALAFQLTGRGADQTWYRQISAAGVHLLGFRKPGVTVRLEPAWTEAPAENAWRVGLNWEGSSRITLTSDDGKVQTQGTLRYRYDVQDRRRVSTPAGSFDVWVVTRQISDDVGGLFPQAQQLWFTPFVGDVRTPEGLLLTGRNFGGR
ncbi:hypothetical protein DEIPH_ctg079orf0134 [Deinococcus phoenicis]|uniref:Lipoprotein n=2 Tax=Deinococcus phoenicis TaxID=1476583 RepID=A0A016QLG8_9DEIO|nr:hypothetical protein DEIPH_ctg079orf0134 [Deinococcus phoenicis]